MNVQLVASPTGSLEQTRRGPRRGVADRFVGVEDVGKGAAVMAKGFQPPRNIGDVSAERIQGRAYESDWARLPAEETSTGGRRSPGGGPDGSPGEGVRWPVVPAVAGFACMILSLVLTFAPLFIAGVVLVLAGMVWSGIRSQSWIARGVGTSRRKKLSGYGSRIHRGSD